jgi:hypothetical protein
MVGGVDIGKQVTDSISSVRSTLNGITDAASAQAALPRLQAATSQIDKVSGTLAQLSDGQRKMLAGLVNPAMSTRADQAAEQDESRASHPAVRLR